MTTNPPADAAKLVERLSQALDAAEAFEEVPGIPYGDVILEFADIRALLDLLAAQASQIEALTAEDVYQAKLLLQIRNKMILFVDEIEDEGDRVYFGSTNHADYLRELEDELDEFDWSRMEKNAEGRDFYAELRALRQEVEAADARATAAEAKAAKMREALRDLGDSMAAILDSDARRVGPAALIPEWLKDVRAALDQEGVLMEPEDQFANEAAELFRKQIEQFARWLEGNWRMTEKDNDASEPKMSMDMMEGWNRALASVPDALNLYLDGEL